MAAPLIGPIPAMELTPGMRIQFEARDPTTDAAVSGVTVDSVALYVEEGSVSDIAQATGPFMLVPGPAAL